MGAELLGEGWASLRQLHPERFGDDHIIELVRGRRPDELVVEPTGSGSSVTAGSAAGWWRGIAHVMGDLLSSGRVGPHRQRCRFRRLTVLVDASRGAVWTVNALARLMTRFALMGISRVMLYVEDTFELDGEPWFGHLRGRYTADQLRVLDDAAARVGIELVLAVQTLGHLTNVVRWPAYRAVRGGMDVLSVDAPETLALIAKMLDAAAVLRTRMVHIGMDETFGVDPVDHARHLGRVVELCERRGFTPMVWTDMALRSPAGRTSDLTVPFDARFAAAAGNAIGVYWDYNHPDVAYHRAQIARHRRMGVEPIVTGAVHCWRQRWTNLPVTLRNLAGQLDAAEECGVSEVMVALWGNDGAETDLRSALPGVQAFADRGWTGSLLPPSAPTGFLGSCNATLASWYEASSIDLPAVDWGNISNFDPTDVVPSNTGFWLMWLDPLFDHVDLGPYGISPEIYRGLAARLEALADSGTVGDQFLHWPALVAAVLADKADLHLRLRPVHQAADISAVPALLALIERLTEGTAALADEHRRLWHQMAGPFGWERIEQRYAGLLSRLEVLSDVLELWADDPSRPIRTLTAPQLPLMHGTQLKSFVRYDDVAGSGVTT